MVAPFSSHCLRGRQMGEVAGITLIKHVCINYQHIVLSAYTFPIGSMYGIFTYIYHKNQHNVGKYTIHGSYGFVIGNVCSYVYTFVFRSFIEKVHPVFSGLGQPHIGSRCKLTAGIWLWRSGEDLFHESGLKSRSEGPLVSIAPIVGSFGSIAHSSRDVVHGETNVDDVSSSYIQIWEEHHFKLCIWKRK